MGTHLVRKFATLALFGLLVVPSLRAEDRPAAKILDDINAVETPKIPQDRNDKAAVDNYIAMQKLAMEKRAELIGELYKSDSVNPELVKLMPTRWSVLSRTPATLPTAKAEVAEIIAKNKNEQLVAEASYFEVYMAIGDANESVKAEELLPLVDKFVAKYPDHVRIPSLLMSLANRAEGTDLQETLFKRIEKDYAKSPIAKQVAFYRKMAESDRERLARVGKPFELEFTEATKGTQITMASLKGKVVVVDFWATWCGPCIAEMPNMKKLYAEYKDKGVEFIGVSLDMPKEKGGLDKLKDYVAKNDIQWPQYYQGNYWQSEFSTSWGINSIPCVFLVDADGNLASVKARGKLETMIPEYLAKAKAKAQGDKTASTR